MQIRFDFQSNRLAHPQQVEQLLFRWTSDYGRLESRPEFVPVTAEAVIDARGELHIGIVLPGAPAQATDVPLSIATEVVNVLASLAAEFGISWNVGHELDPELGTISSQGASDGLIKEIQTAIEIAQSLSELAVAPSDEDIDRLASPDLEDRTWDELFQPSDPFIRFPEFE